MKLPLTVVVEMVLWMARALPPFPLIAKLMRAILGSVECMFAILLEHYKVKWPFWLSPRQAIVCPVSDKSQPYGVEYVDIDTSDKTIQKKMGKSPGKWIKSVLFREKTSNSSLPKEQDIPGVLDSSGYHCSGREKWRATPVRKTHISTSDLSRYVSNQPSHGISKVLFGGQTTSEEAESLNRSH